MSSYTYKELSILSLLAERPRHGLDLETSLRELHAELWEQIGLSSIYRILTSLERDGLVGYELEPPSGRGPGRKVYSLSEAGRRALQELAFEALISAPSFSPGFPLGLLASGNLEPHQLLHGLESHLQSLLETHALLESMIERIDARPAPIISMYDYMRTQLVARIAWLADYMERLD